MIMTLKPTNKTPSSVFFWRCRVSLVKFSYWSKFHVNIMTGSRVMIIFVYKGLTKNPEIGNTPVWVLLNIWRLGEFGIVNLARMSRIKCYWILWHARVTAFTVSDLLKLGSHCELTWNNVKQFLRLIFHFMLFHNGNVLKSCYFTLIMN